MHYFSDFIIVCGITRNPTATGTILKRLLLEIRGRDPPGFNGVV